MPGRQSLRNYDWQSEIKAVNFGYKKSEGLNTGSAVT